MADIHFISDPGVMQILTTILDIVGPNYTLPYDSSVQPSDASKRNTDDLLQYQLPGGGSLQGYTDPAQSQSIGNSINSMLAALAPFLSAYQMLLPIIGIIRGIIEVICALLNPWAVISAIIKLFSKYIPPFISLFPPLAGIVLILSTIKAILAIVFFILTTIVPWIQLIINNIQTLAANFGTNRAAQDAGRKKLLSLLMSLLNQLGVLNILKPLLEIIFFILGLAAGFPCSKDEEDSTCCNDNVCPPVLKDPPKGLGLISPTFFGESEPGIIYRVFPITSSGGGTISDLYPYMQDFENQIQSDEKVIVAKPAGGNNISAMFQLKLTKRGSSNVSSLVSISDDGSLIIFEPNKHYSPMILNYEIIPNWDMLIANSVVGLACHPDVYKTKELIKNRYATKLPGPAIVNVPETASVKDDYNNMANNLINNLNSMNNVVYGVVRDGEIDPKTPPYDEDISKIEEIRDSTIQMLIDFINAMKNKMQLILGKSFDPLSSEFNVDKNLVNVGDKDKSVISVIPKDITGSFLLKNLPDGVSLNVTLHTNFGVIKNQRIDNSTGTVIAELTSSIPGTAIINAKINGIYLQELINNIAVTKNINVRFISDAILPARRLVSKPSPSTSQITTLSNDREPGGK